MAAAKPKAIVRPRENDGEISAGKNEWPVRYAARDAGRWLITGPSSVCTGL